jgi:predicted transcriptional regulator of viral defense system
MLAYYAKIGRLERLGHGVYAPSGRSFRMYEELEPLLKKGTKFVVCLLSALRLHDFTSQSPSSIWIAIPQGHHPPSFAGTPPVYIYPGAKNFDWGVEYLEVEGLTIPVYSAARTVADCFKYRNKFGLDIAIEALHDGYRRKKFTIRELHQAGEICRVSNVMSPYIMGMLR